MKTWWFLWRLFLFKKWALSLQVASAVVTIVVMEHTVALVQREVFDTLTGDPGVSLGVWALCAILVALALGYSVTFIGDELLWRFNRFTLAALLQRNAFDHVLELRGDRSLPASPGEAVSRFRDDPRQALTNVLDFDILVAHLLFLLVAIVIMVQISAVTVFSVFLPLVAVTLVVHTLRERIERYRRAAREAAGGVTGFIGEMFGMVETVKTSNAEGRVIDEFNRANEQRGRTSLRDEVFTEVLRAVSSNVHNIATGLMLALLARSMSQGTLTVGDLSLFVFYLAQTQSFTTAIGELMSGYRQVGVSVNRLLDLMPGSAPEALVEPTRSYLLGHLPEVEVPERKAGDRLEVLDVEGLSYVYPENGEGVRDVSFSLRGCLQSLELVLNLMNEPQIVPQRPDGRTVGDPRAPTPTSQTRRPTPYSGPAGGSERHPVFASERMPLADGPARSASLADPVQVLPQLDHGWNVGTSQ